MAEILTPIDALIADIRTQRGHYPADAVLSLIERLAVLLRGHIEVHPKRAHP